MPRSSKFTTSTSSNPESVTGLMPCTKNQCDRNQTVPRAGSNIVREEYPVRDP